MDCHRNLLYNPDWIATLGDATIKYVMAHEVMHVALKHLYRIGSRQPTAWNMATDSADNDILKGTFPIPKQCVHFEKMAGKSAEEIYDWCIKNARVMKLTILDLVG